MGKIKSCSRATGIAVSLGFFDDVVIPPESLPHPSRFEESDQVWVWEYQMEDDEKHDMFMDVGEEIRFKVTSETFVDTSPCSEPTSSTEPPAASTAPRTPLTPSAPLLPSSEPQHPSATTTADLVERQEEKKIPYLIQATVAESGLGPTSWWNS